MLRTSTTFSHLARTNSAATLQHSIYLTKDWANMFVLFFFIKKLSHKKLRHFTTLNWVMQFPWTTYRDLIPFQAAACFSHRKLVGAPLHTIHGCNNSCCQNRAGNSFDVHQPAWSTKLWLRQNRDLKIEFLSWNLRLRIEGWHAQQRGKQTEIANLISIFRCNVISLAQLRKLEV